jgi:hypothetical protein
MPEPRGDRGFGERRRTGAPGNGEPGAGPERFWHEFGRAGPRGTASEEPPFSRPETECLDWCPICRTADVLRATTPPEFRGQLQGMQHDALVALRSLLDSYIERIERDEHSSARVQDIPIE